jgi:hypothetical protein
MVRKDIRHTNISVLFINRTSPLTCCDYAIVERIAMTKRKFSEPLPWKPKKLTASTDLVCYQPATSRNICSVSATKVSKRPMYQCFIPHGGQYFLLGCKLDLGIMTFVISLEAAKECSIPEVESTECIKTGDVSGIDLDKENLFTVPLGISLQNHRCFDKNGHAFEVIKSAAYYDALARPGIQKLIQQGGPPQVTFIFRSVSLNATDTERYIWNTKLHTTKGSHFARALYMPEQ